MLPWQGDSIYFVIYGGIVVNFHVLSHKQIYFSTRDEVLFTNYFTTFRYLYCKWLFQPGS